MAEEISVSPRKDFEEPERIEAPKSDSNSCEEIKDE